MSQQSLFDKWRDFTDGLTSPDVYVSWGFYYLISASLQRRVWTGPPHMQLYPNIYVILVGEPGVGKGLVTRQVNRILRHHKLDTNSSNPIDKANVEKAEEADIKKLKGQPLLIPVGANATTWEALVSALAASLRRINYPYENPVTLKTEKKIYSHSSLCFCLEEISSMFRKRTEEVARFLLETYDCGDYEYDTKTAGLKEYIQRSCLNLLGGTTPSYMQELFSDRLLSEGFASRCFFIFAARNRKNAFYIPDLTAAQQQCYDDILLHVKKLTTLYGRVTYNTDTQKFLDKWWEDSQSERPNSSYKLNHYYARKNLHLSKLTLARHFATSTSMELTQQEFEETLEFMDPVEKMMHLALGVDETNPLMAPAMKIHSYLKHNANRGFTHRELLVEFYASLPSRPSPKDNLNDILEHLQISGKILRKEGVNKQTAKTEYLYQVMRETDV